MTKKTSHALGILIGALIYWGCSQVQTVVNLQQTGRDMTASQPVNAPPMPTLPVEGWLEKITSWLASGKK